MIRRLALGLLALVAVVIVGSGLLLASLLWRADLWRGPIERLVADRLGLPVQINGQLSLHPGRVVTVDVGGVRILAPDWAESPVLASVERLRVGFDLGAYLGDGRLVFTEIVLDGPELTLARDASGRRNWSTAAEEPPAADQPAGEPLVLPEIRALSISGGMLCYHDALTQVALDLRVATTEAAAAGGFGGLTVAGDGLALGRPLVLDLEVGSPLLLASGAAPFPIAGELRSGDSVLSLDGAAGDALGLDGLDLRLALRSPDPAPFLALLGRPVPVGAAPALALDGRLTADRGTYALRDLALGWGDSRAEGELSYAGAAERPRLEGRLHATLLDLVALAPVLAAEAPTPPAPPAEPATVTPGPLATHDGLLDLRVDRLRLPALEITDLQATAKLQDGVLSADPLRLSLPKGGVSGRLGFSDLDGGSFAGTVDVTAQGVELGTLLPGASGIVALALAGDLEGSDLAALLRESRLRLTVDAADVVLAALGGSPGEVELTADTGGSGDRPLGIAGDGTFAGEPFQISAHGAALDALLAQPISYPLELALTALGSTLELDGTLPWPLEAGGLDLALDLTSRDLDLALLLGPEAGLAATLTGEARGRISGRSLGEILARSRLTAQGELTGLRLPRLGDRLQRLAFEAGLAESGDRPVRLRLDGTLAGEPLALELAGGDLPRQPAAETDYPLSLDARIGATRASAEGTLAWPLERNRLRLSTTLEGPDPAQVLRLLELPEITLPPYRIAGELTRDGDDWRLAGIDGRVGDSDVAGEIGVALGGERPAVSGDLHAEMLDLDDLLGLVGAEPAAGPAETASGEQKAEARADAADGQVLPDERIDPDSWRQLDADIALRADKVQAGILPLDSFDMRIGLDDGALRVDPLLLRLGEGRIDGTLALDGRRRPAVAEVEIDLVQLPVGRLLERLGVDTSSFGTLSGQARGGVGVAGRGASVAEILGSADGSLTLVMEGGTINRRLVDLMGFDFLNLFGSMIGTTPAELDLSCTLADLAIRDGIVSTRALVIDTEAADLGGEGEISLKDETIDIELIARPKGSPLPSGRTGITIGGTLAEPDISFSAGTLAARGAAAATIGVFLRPFTALASAILPASGAADRSACGNLLAGAD